MPGVPDLRARGLHRKIRLNQRVQDVVRFAKPAKQAIHAPTRAMLGGTGYEVHSVVLRGLVHAACGGSGASCRVAVVNHYLKEEVL